MTTRIQTTARVSRNQRASLRRANAALAALFALHAFGSLAGVSAQSVNPDSLLAHVRYLASDALAGREAGSPGADSAAFYIAERFARYGLEPLATERYTQSFEITTGIAIAGDSRLVLRSSRGSRTLKLYEEWLPFNFSSAGRVRGVAFSAGYGLSADAYGSSEAGGHTPRIAIVRGGTPDDFDPHSGGFDTTPRRKATLAREQSISAVLITVPRIDVPRLGEPPHPIGIPALQVIENDELGAWLNDDDLQIELEASIEPVRVKAYNVAGRLPGRDPQAEELIVIGAHYDHLGLGGPGSLAPDVEAPHNGADDNASGTAVLLGLAQYFAERPERRPPRSLVFVAFSAEEMGLLGSDHFVTHPPFPLDRVRAMVNFDMVGRLRDGKLQVFGSETAEEFPALLDTLDARSELSLTHIGDGYGPSDQTSFYSRKIPVLHLFTGTHSEYHRPEDDWQLINADGMAQVAELAIDLIRELGARSGELHLVDQERPQAGGGGYGPYLGTIPDFGEVEGGGLRLSGVRAGSPAELGGLQAGDVVIEFGGNEVLNIYDYTYALREHAPGDTVMIKVRREGDVLELTAVLGRRE